MKSYEIDACVLCIVDKNSGLDWDVDIRYSLTKPNLCQVNDPLFNISFPLVTFQVTTTYFFTESKIYNTLIHFCVITSKKIQWMIKQNGEEKQQQHWVPLCVFLKLKIKRGQ